ncbi:uncharacterized protein LOC127726361 [Mytilus californianus]|uniref:uncharacterized protein LOC127726361 n=1 Tax=Mytilus californianus TaxID=6549 RepID=UPI002245743E|nr:uncharacterized protein LOC127726361 [Mytilus californianus]
MHVIQKKKMLRYFSWISFVLCFSTSIWTKQADGQCMMPFGEEDTYVSASTGTIGANVTHIIDYPLTIPFTPKSDFECLEKRDDRYVLKMVIEPNIFGTITRFYMCIELFKENNVTFYYYLGTDFEVFAQDHLYGDSTGGTVTFEDVCNRAYPYGKQTFVMLVKADAYDNGLLTTRCPDDLLAIFQSVNITLSDGTITTSCPGNTLDVCANRTTVSFGYNDSCSSPAKQTSHNGSYSCLFYTTVNSFTYLGLWNQDNTVDDTNNYRFSCFAFKKEGGTVYSTETPKFCDTATTATNPGPDGVTIVSWDISEICLDGIQGSADETIDTDISWIYYLIAGLAILPLLIWFICLFILCYKKYGCICKRIKIPKVKLPTKNKKRLSPKPPSEPEIDVSKGEIVGRARFTGPIIKGPDYNMSNLFRPKKPVDDFTMLGAIFIDNKPLCLLGAPNIRPIYKDTFDDYMMGGLRRSYTQISIDSSIYEKKED